MAARLTAAAVLLVSGIVAWLAISVPLAARALQVSIAVSIAYVAWLAWHGWRVMRRAVADARSGAGEPTGLARDLPFVSLVMPARNEAAVIGPSVAAARGLAYTGPDGAPAYELLVVDDGSSDNTGDVARRTDGAATLTVVRREPGGARTKGAALSFAMPYVRGQVVGVIDADTLLDRSFLERAMRAWRRDESAAALQVARQPRNTASWLTRAQAEEQLMDMASQCGRWVTDGTAELRGNGMFVRRDILDSVGGWSDGALTEDLELSTRLSSAGHHVTLAPEATVHEEAVESLTALWRQRMRWAEGSVRRLLEHGPGLLAGAQPPGRKLDFLAFAGEFLVPPLFVAAVTASVLTIPMPRPADWTVPVSLFVGYGLGSFLLAIAGLAAAGERGLPLVGRAARGALFLSHWLVVVPAALARIALGVAPTFVQTPRSGGRLAR
ncbi:MAG: glycosyltransferase family 2 protein [Chloroflexota bacterium]